MEKRRGRRAQSVARACVAAGVGALLATAHPAQSAQIEFSAQVGQALPFYEQSFAYDPGSIRVEVPGLANIDIQQRGGFGLDGKGGSTIGGGVTLWIASSFGIEARMDSAAIDIKATGATYNVRVDLPAPIPDLATDFDFGVGTFDADRLRPISLNLRFKTAGKLALTVSGGVSYLPHLRITARQRLGLGVTNIDERLSGLNVGSLVFHADVDQLGDDTNSVGGNVGVGLRLNLGGPLSVTGEARYFAFPKHKVEWTPEIDGPLSPLEDALVDGVRDRLDPIEFYPAFFQATAGLSLTF